MSITRAIACTLILSFAAAGCNRGKSQRPYGPAGDAELIHLETVARQILLRSVYSAEPAIRCHALESLAHLGGLGTLALVRKQLYDPVPAVQFAAAVAAGDLRDHAARNFLEELLSSENISVQLGAAYALERMGDTRFANWYDHVLASSDERLCGQACWLLGKLGTGTGRADSTQKLWAVLGKVEQSPSIRLQAAEALARLGDQSVLRKLLVFASSAYADDRILASSGLGLISGPDAYSMLTVLADDPQIEVRLAAARALAENAHDNDRQLARDTLANYIDPQQDPIVTARVRGLAAMTLGAIGQHQDASVLLETMGLESEYIRLAAARAAAELARRLRRKTPAGSL